jgi:Arc/MetJ-type ribon-helix-helix transcriptional regulator
MLSALPDTPDNGKYNKSKAEDYSVLTAVRITPNMDGAIERFMQNEGRGFYDSRADFIRDSIWQNLQKRANLDASTTIVGGLKLLSMAASDEQFEVTVMSTVGQMEAALEFYMREGALDKVEDLLDRYNRTVDAIRSEFWVGYLHRRMDNSPVFDEARRMTGGVP